MDNAILQIVPRAPGGRDGVGDYALTLARGLRRAHGLETTFASAAPSVGIDLPEDFPVLAPLRAIAAEEWPETYAAVVLHFVNYGYAPRGVPLWLPRVLRRVQGTGKLLTIFHELYASGSWRQSAYWLRPLQVRIARSIAQMSNAAIVSSEVLRDQLTLLAPDKKIIVRPVVSNFGEPAFSSAELAQRDPQRWVICGGTELIERSLDSFLKAARWIGESCAPRDLFVVGGADNPRVRQQLAGETRIQTHYHPEIEARLASQILASCAFGWIDYFTHSDAPTPAILKSTAFAACCAHGVIPVFPTAGSVIALEGDALPGPFYVAGTGQNLPLETERPAAAQSIHAWYSRHASSAHLAAAVAAALA